MDIDSDGFGLIATELAPGLSAAGLHGALAGALCGTATMRGNRFALAAVIGIDAAQVEAWQGELDAALQTIELDLRDQDCAFRLLLPDDESALELRVSALAQWCDAFVAGFSASCRDQDTELSDQTTELLGDLSSIAGGLGEQALADGSDEDEEDFMQICEFVRIAALSIFGERGNPVPEQVH